MKLIVTLVGPQGDIVKRINVRFDEATPGALEGLGIEDMRHIIDLDDICLVSSVNIEGSNK